MQPFPLWSETMPSSRLTRSHRFLYALSRPRLSDQRNLCRTAIPRCHTGRGKELYVRPPLSSSGCSLKVAAPTHGSTLPFLRQADSSPSASSDHFPSRTGLGLQTRSPVYHSR